MEGKYAKSSKAARERRKAKIAKLKDAPCTDCNVKYPPYVMQYDHIADNKVMKVSRLLGRASWDTVLAEIAKCELVCANCHAVRTYVRANA